ncbi:MAG: hypothetical protein ACLR7D_05805 [Lachnospira eligens]
MQKEVEFFIHSLQKLSLLTLSKKYPLYIVSNCQDGYIESFLTAHLMSDFFKDTECWGRTFLPKSESNKILIERNINSKNPVYKSVIQQAMQSLPKMRA